MCVLTKFKLFGLYCHIRFIVCILVSSSCCVLTAVLLLCIWWQQWLRRSLSTRPLEGDTTTTVGLHQRYEHCSQSALLKGIFTKKCVKKIKKKIKHFRKDCFYPLHSHTFGTLITTGARHLYKMIFEAIRTPSDRFSKTHLIKLFVTVLTGW